MHNNFTIIVIIFLPRLNVRTFAFLLTHFIHNNSLVCKLIHWKKCHEQSHRVGKSEKENSMNFQKNDDNDE